MNTPKDIDTRLAEIHNDINKTLDKIASNRNSLLQLAGAEFYYIGKRRVTDMKVNEALEILEPIVEANKDDEYGYSMCLPARGANLGQARNALTNHVELQQQLERLEADADEVEALYTGWSRFFLVTSSPGHIHSSMRCSSCRHTTRFGWLPQLSGQDEEAAVAELGPTLCTVCFPSAPVTWTEGKKITAAQAAKKVA